MKKIIITIGRENGSGGRYVGELLAKKLGIKCYNDELLIETAKKYNLDLSHLKKTDEKTPYNFVFYGGQTVPSELFQKEANFIKELASKESCIIIGRCSNYILSDFENVINVFIHAPLGSRIERYANRNGVDVIKAEKIITKEDKERANYYNFYTSQIWGEANSYNLSIDTSKTGIDGAVKLIEDYIKIVDDNNCNDNKIR